jgi:hypothetical protein
MTKKDALLFDLIFSEKSNFVINISEYLEQDIYKYDRFIDEVKNILEKSAVTLISENLDLNKKGPIWTIKVKK